MHIAYISGRPIALSLRWKALSQIDRVAFTKWADAYHADRGVWVKSDESISLGVVEGSLNTDLSEHKSMYSLAALYSKEFRNGIVLMKMPAGETSEPLYWGALIDKGVVEFDFASTILSDIVDAICKRIDDIALGLLNVPYPLLYTNLSRSIKGEELTLIRLQSVVRVEGVDSAERELSVTPHSYNELQTIVSTIKGKDGLITTSISADFSLGRILSAFGPLTREKIVAGLAGVAVIISLPFLFLNFDESYEMATDALSVQPVAPVPPPKSVDFNGQVSDRVTEYLIGSNKEWVKFYFDQFSDLPNITFGYRKEGLSCNVTVGFCEVYYKPTSTYKEFSKAINQLRPKFDDTFFGLNGDDITGRIKIKKEILYFKHTKVSDLPIFDRGESLIGIMQGLSTTRPGLSVSLTKAQEVRVTPKDTKIKMPDHIESNFMVAGWTATGLYPHQAWIVLSEMNNPTVTVNSFEFEREKVGFNFRMSGGYLMRSSSIMRNKL